MGPPGPLFLDLPRLITRITSRSARRAMMPVCRLMKPPVKGDGSRIKCASGAFGATLSPRIRRPPTRQPHRIEHEGVAEGDLPQTVVAARRAAMAPGEVDLEVQGVGVRLQGPELRHPLRRLPVHDLRVVERGGDQHPWIRTPCTSRSTSPGAMA